MVRCRSPVDPVVGPALLVEVLPVDVGLLLAGDAVTPVLLTSVPPLASVAGPPVASPDVPLSDDASDVPLSDDASAALCVLTFPTALERTVREAQPDTKSTAAAAMATDLAHRVLPMSYLRSSGRTSSRCCRSSRSVISRDVNNETRIKVVEPV